MERNLSGSKQKEYRRPDCELFLPQQSLLIEYSFERDETGVVNPDPWDDDEYGGSLAKETKQLSLWDDDDDSDSWGSCSFRK